MKYLKTYKIFENVVTELDYSEQRRKSLPELPKSLKYLYCYNNQLKSLPELPKLLESLDCGDNQLESLPELPDSLKYLFCHNNKLKSIPKLPDSLIILCCDNNPLECLIPEKFIHYQDKEWLDYHYYPMINSYEGQKKILQNDITQLEE